MSDELCIIGMAGKYPKSDNIDKLWGQLCFGENFIEDCPESRQEFIKEVYGEKVNFPRAAYFSDIFEFDNEFFHISPKDSEVMDPYQKMFLEVSYQALENAGLLGIERIKSIGVFVGISTEYSKKAFQNILYDAKYERYKDSFIGNLPAAIPARIAYYLDLHGPTLLVDTSCSSSITAFDMACKSVINKECKAAVVGGINIFTDPSENSVVKELGIFSEDSRINAFDDKRGGVVNGEGCGVVVIKRLSDALADRDNIYCIVKSSFCNQDGKSLGMTAPNMEAQAECIKNAWKEAKIDPSNIRYIEAHGTGTELGDPTEVGAINRAFEYYSVPNQSCGIGSIKTNLGHTIGAAGVTSIIKCSLILKNKVIPPSLNFSYPNRNISFEDSPVYVVSNLEKISSSKEKSLCCINSFGITGTNGHVVLEEYIEERVKKESLCSLSKRYPVLFSAIDNNRLREKIIKFKLAKQLEENKIIDLSFSSIFRTRIFREKIVFWVRNIDELYEEIEQYLNKSGNYKNNFSSFVCNNTEDKYFQLTLLLKEENYSQLKLKFFEVFPEMKFVLYYPYISETFVEVSTKPVLNGRNIYQNIQADSFIPITRKEEIMFDKSIKKLEILYITSKGFLYSDEDLSYEDIEKKKKTNWESLLDSQKLCERVVCINDSTKSDSFSLFYSYIKDLAQCLSGILEKRAIKQLVFVGISNTTSYVMPSNNSFFGIFKSLIFENPRVLIKCFEVNKKLVINQTFKIVNKRSISKIFLNYLEYEELSAIQVKGDSYKHFFKGKKIGIIGGTGRIGQKLIPLLLEDKVEKICIYHRNDNSLEKSNSKIEYKIVDISNLDVKNYNYKLFEDIDIVINLAVEDNRFSLSNFNLDLFRKSFDIKAKGTQSLIELCKMSGVGQILNFSSVIDYIGGSENLSYIMGNSFIDGLSDMYREDENIIVQSINWPEWGNIGIAEEVSFSNSESLFEKVRLREGYTFMRKVLAQGVPRIAYGKINEGSHLLDIKEMLPTPFDICSETPDGKRKSIEIEVDKEELGEDVIVKVISSVMGYITIDIQKNFIELGGDSITALKICSILLSNNIETEPNLLLRTQCIRDFISLVIDKNN